MPQIIPRVRREWVGGGNFLVTFSFCLQEKIQFPQIQLITLRTLRSVTRHCFHDFHEFTSEKTRQWTANARVGGRARGMPSILARKFASDEELQ